MNYVRQLNAFGEKSIGVLSAGEQAMYLRLFLVANQLHRPEWFTVSNTQLMRELKVKSEHTIIKDREQLHQKGFLDFRNAGKGKMTTYHLPILYEATPAKNAVHPCKKCSTPLQKMQYTPAKNAVHPCKKCSTPLQKMQIS